MSAYKEIRSEFRQAHSLIKALEEIGLRPVAAANLKINERTMKNRWGHGDRQVAIEVSHEQFAAALGGSAWAGLGFTWNGQRYDIVMDDLDINKSQDVVNRLRQRYAYHEIRAQAARKGYTVREVKSTDGTIRLQLTHR